MPNNPRTVRLRLPRALVRKLAAQARKEASDLDHLVLRAVRTDLRKARGQSCLERPGRATGSTPVQTDPPLSRGEAPLHAPRLAANPHSRCALQRTRPA